MAAMHWQTTRFLIDLHRPQVMGIVNVTPDSFSDGGRYADHRAALRHCEQLLKDGADILDIGGESSRPGADPLPLEEEMQRVIPVLKHALTLGVPVSLDTYKPQLMQLALDMGVDIINDIWALRQPGAAAMVQAHPSCGVCLMHMHREPQTMQAAPMVGDVVAQVRAFLAQVAGNLRAQGVAANRICIDPGVGFGKTVEQNFALLPGQAALLTLGYPLLVGWSRKSSLAAAAQTDDIEDRLAPSIAAAVLAMQHGAHIVRVHDVHATVQARAVWTAAHNTEKETSP